jgi:CRISPR-associated protein Csb1
LQDGFKAILNKNAEPIAKIAPTSLVFGVWDSRDTQAKLPRLVASTIRAFNVRKLTRSAVYAPPVDYSTLDVFSEEDKTKAEGDTKNPLAKRGFVHVPASSSHGGVIAEGGIRRDATLGLSALRLLNGLTAERTLALRRYILGLALTAFTHSPSGYLRQGCLLVSDPDRAKEREFVEVYPSGERQPAIISHEDAFAYAQIVADAFIVGADRTVNFVQDLATKDVQAKGDDKTAKKTGKKAAKKLDQSPIDPEIT